MPLDLLDKLAQECGCFISGLRYEENLWKAVFSMKNMEFTDADLPVCSEALSYLFSTPLQFETVEDMQNFLKTKQK